ncbi:MAG: hypothetical protein ACYTBJ_27200 [Planctomycetota bacterium]
MANQSATEWISFTHNQTNGLISSGTGLELTTSSNNDISLVPNGTGIVNVGSGSPSHLTPTSGELYVQGIAEFDQVIYGDTHILQSQANSLLGHSSSSYSRIVWQSAAQTPDTTLFTTGTVSNHIVICEYGDSSYDFAHAQQTNPTLFIQSANQSATEWISLAHNQTDGVIGYT